MFLISQQKKYEKYDDITSDNQFGGDNNKYSNYNNNLTDDFQYPKDDLKKAIN